MEEHTGQFSVATDDGQRFVVHSYVEIIAAGPLTDPHATVRGRLPRLETDEGYTVSPLDDRSFRILDLDVIAHKVGVA